MEEEAGRQGELGPRAAPGAAQPGDQREGNALRTLDIQRPARGSRDRSSRAIPAPTRVPTAEPPLPRRGCDSITRGPEGRGPGRRAALRGRKALLAAATEWR